MNTLVLIAVVINLNHGANRNLPWLSQQHLWPGWVLPCLHFIQGGLLPLKSKLDEGHHVLENDTHYDSVTFYIFIFYLTSIFIHSKSDNKCSVSLSSFNLWPLKSACLIQSPLPFLSLSLPLPPTSLYLYLIANAGSIAAAIDLCVETPSRQEKWRPVQSHFLRGCKSGRKWLLFHRHCRY